MSVGPLGLNGLNKAPIPTSSKFSTPTISPLNPRLPSMDARLVAARLPGLAMYGSPYASPNFPGYLPYGPAAAAVAAATDPSSFYPAMGPGENADAWRVGLSQTAAAYFDPAMAAHYGYGYGPIGLSDGARRKNATRETTSTLKNWLNEHRKNPYPTKGEKIMLAIITKMTLTQVSTWFANARRRLKKENKMTWSPRNRCGEDDEDDDDLAEDSHHNNEHSHSRTSSPITPASMPTNGLTGHSSRQLPFNGHHSGAESISDEGIGYSEALRLPPKPDRDGNEKSEEKSSTSSSVLRQSSLDETRNRISSSHLARHAAHPYQSSRSSPSFSAFSTNITPSMQSSITRPVMPFPTPIPHIPGASHPSMVHPGVAGQFNHAAAASLLAASRGHTLPPHLLAALSEQMHYQQALQTLPINSFLNSNEISKSSSNPTISNSSPSSNREPSPAIVSKASSTAASPTKPKIWSLADVATNGEAPKSLSKEKLPETSQAQDQRSQSSPKDINGANLIDSDFHQKLVIAMSRHYNLPNGLTQQQIHQLVTGIDANSSQSTISQTRFSPQLSGFAGISIAKEKAKVKELEKFAQSNNETQEMLERASSTGESLETTEKALDKNAKNRLATSPSGSHHRDSSMELTP